MKPSVALTSFLAGVFALLAFTLSTAAPARAAAVMVQLEAWSGSTRVFLCDFSSGSNCGTHTVPRGTTQNLRYEIGGSDHNISCISSPWNFSWWPNASHDYTAQDPPVTWTVDCEGDVGGATKSVTLAPWDPPPTPPPPPPPPPPPFPASISDIYGDNPNETQTGHWTGPGWTVNQYANRYVVTTGRGIYVIGRSASGTGSSDYPGHYIGPGYIGQFSPAEGPPNKMVVNDPLEAQGSESPRGGVHGGLGCFAMDLYRVNVGGVDLNCRLFSNGSSAGVYQVDNESVTPNSDGVTLALRTRYRDSVGPVFSVTYSHHFTAANVLTTTTWLVDATDNTDLFGKEPRIVSVFGTAEVPVYNGQGKYRDGPPNCDPPRPDGTYGYGDGVWGLEPDLLRKDYKPGHYWTMNDVVPWCSTISVGPGATSSDRQYHRGGFSFDVVNAQHPRDFTVEDPGYYHDYDGPSQPTRNFNVWRRNADSRAVIPGYEHTCTTGQTTEHCRMPICDTCSANAWELGRDPGQYGVFVAIEAWRASIGLDDYWGRARRIPQLGAPPYSETFKF